MDIEKEFLPNKKNLLVVSSGDYYNGILDSLKPLSGKSICYVTLNKTRKALQEDFKENGIDMENMIIIDAISKTVEASIGAEEHCLFVNSPGALTELSISIKKFLNYGFDYLIFDSLNNLLVYRDAPIVKRWVSSIMGNIRESNTRAIFYILNSEGQKDFIKEVGAFVDKVIDLDKGEIGDGGGSVAFSGKLKEGKIKSGGS